MTPAKKSKTGRFERVTNLALALMNSETPITLERLVAAIPGYPNNGDEATLRMAFERDKRILRDQNLTIVVTESGTSRSLGYAVSPRRESTNIALDLRHDEIFQLAFALSVFRFDSPAARDALLKLVRYLPIDELQDRLSSSVAAFAQSAVESRRSIRLTHNNCTYDIEPYGIVRQADGWVLVGRDRHFDDVRVRSFCGENISSVLLGPANSYETPQQFDPMARSVDDDARFVDDIDNLQAVSNRAVDAGGRFGRLMAILSYLATAKSVPTQWLANMVQIRTCDLIAELETAACCGVEPYTPDRLLEICVDEDTVQGNELEQFAQPFALNTDEVTAAVKAAWALLTITSSEQSATLQSAIDRCASHTNTAFRDEPTRCVDWPPEWSSFVRLRVSEILPWFKRLVVDEPLPAKEGSVDVVAFLADRRWRHALLDALGDSAELIDDTRTCGPEGVPDRRLAEHAIG